MAYKNADDPGFLQDILSRKEFYQVRKNSSNEQNDADAAAKINNMDSMKGEYLELRGHQLFVNNFQSPNTKYKRLLLKHQTGVGKTLSSVAIAHTFMNAYKKIYENTLLQTGLNRKGRVEADLITPSVFIIGFTKSIFIKEILKYPEFGFISYEEHAELERLRKESMSGMTNDVEKAKDFYSMLKRRISNKAKGGFYKFYGYQEFVNKLFYSETINLTDLENIAIKKMSSRGVSAKEGGGGISGADAALSCNEADEASPSSEGGREDRSGRTHVDSLEDLIYYYMEKGEIQVNTTLLKQFENSLLICDEIHNTYNSMMKNNYGVAIQYVLDYTPSLRALFLSATVAYHSPTEVIDLMNLLLPKDKRIYKRDFFTAKKDIKQGSLEKLGILSRGYISFLQETNPEYYPEKIYSGEPHKLKQTCNMNDEIPYLKFVDCIMSEYHSEAYEAFLKSTGQTSSDTAVLPTDSYPLNDLVYPVPVESHTAKVSDVEQSNGGDSTSINSINVGPNTAVAFKSTYIRNALLKASESWKKANGIELDVSKSGAMIISGNWLKCNQIGKYCSKYATILAGIFNSFENAVKAAALEIKETKSNDTFSVLRKHSIKIMIYHPRVKMSGVMQLEALLKQNGFIGLNEEPISKTICTFCGVIKDKHSNANLAAREIPSHDFVPARLIMAHSDFDKTIMDNQINMFNETSNTYGEYIKCLVGSKIIRQSYDIKCIRLFYMVSLPVSIPELIQILGRIARMDSHKDLQFAYRNVNINMLLSTSKTRNTYEEIKYVEKIMEYKIIQNIEKEFNKNAVDSDIMRPVIMSEHTLRQYFGDERVDDELRKHGNLSELMYADESTAKEIFGNLYYLPAARVPSGFSAKDMNNNTFHAYKYFETEYRLIAFIIKQLFIRNRVWKYEDLWKAVTSENRFEVNTSLIDEGNFSIVLNALASPDNVIWRKDPIKRTNINVPQNAEKSYKMIDEDRIIKKKIIRDMFSPDEKIITVINGSVMSRFKIGQAGEFYILFPMISASNSAFSFQVTSQNNKPSELMVKDVESYAREVKYSPGLRINLDMWVKESRAEHNYSVRKQNFIQIFTSALNDAVRDRRDDDVSFMRPLLWDYTSSFQRRLLKEIIEWEINRNVKISEDLADLYSAVIDLYDEFAAIIYVKNVITYKDVAKKFSTGNVIKWKKGESKPYSDLDKMTPVGFMDKDSVLLFDGVTWIKVNKVAMNIRTEFQENGTIIGYFDDIKNTDIVKFKMRRPIHEIRKTANATKSDDIRLLERGMVCETRNKQELARISKELKINITGIAEPGKVKIKNICDSIRDRLIDLEAAERQKDSKIKYFYMFYDSQPSVS